MSLVINPSSLILWQDIVKHAENRCAVTLEGELEIYLTTLLARYVNRPEVVKQLFANAFLEALNLRPERRAVSLQMLGDQCLIFAGLFPKAAAKKNVTLSYFVDMGRCAYTAVSKSTNDLYNLLALQFVVLMDVLQSIGPNSHLMPLEAYEQWNEVGSRRALQILQEYTSGTPYKSGKH